jgi:hypothetical protein
MFIATTMKRQAGVSALLDRTTDSVPAAAVTDFDKEINRANSTLLEGEMLWARSILPMPLSPLL